MQPRVNPQCSQNLGNPLSLLHSTMTAGATFLGLSPSPQQRSCSPFISSKRLKMLQRNFLGAPLELQRALSSMHPRIPWTMMMIVQILLFMTVMKTTWMKSRISYPSASSLLADMFSSLLLVCSVTFINYTILLSCCLKWT